MFRCDKCSKEFDKQYLLKRHLNRKNTCYKPHKFIAEYNKKIQSIDDEIERLTKLSIVSTTICRFCKEEFFKKGNMMRHLNNNTCDVKKQLINDKEELFEKKTKLENEITNNELIELRKLKELNDLKELKELKEIKQMYKTNKKTKPKQTETIETKEFKEFKELCEFKEFRELKDEFMKMLNKQSTNTTNNINNTTNINNPTINNNNNLTININSFGKESLTHITDDDYKKYFNSFFKGFLNFIEKIHFDENAPENHNLCLTNIRSKYINVCENNNWILKEKDEIIDKLINKKYDLLNDKFEEFEGAKKLSDKVSDNFKEFQENYTDVEAQKTTKENVKLMLYNKRDKLKTVRK
jgi:hypothetical protein